jgi:hypothetical protein
MTDLLIFLHSSPRISVQHLHCDLMDISRTIQELGQRGQTNLGCAFAGLDGESVHVTTGSRCAWTSGLQLLRDLRCEIARDTSDIAAKYE